MLRTSSRARSDGRGIDTPRLPLAQVVEGGYLRPRQALGALLRDLCVSDAPEGVKTCRLPKKVLRQLERREWGLTRDHQHAGANWRLADYGGTDAEVEESRARLEELDVGLHLARCRWRSGRWASRRTAA